MKHTTHFILSLITAFLFWQVLSFLGVSVWWTLLLLPVFGLVQIQATNQFNFRDSLQIEEIPMEGYESRIQALQQSQNMANYLGFRRFDNFYLPISTDVVVYAYQHELEPIYLCDYHLGKFQCFDLVTKFENGTTLTTANGENAGLIPRPPEAMLQVFTGLQMPDLVEKHRQSLLFLKQKGLQTAEVEVTGFRQKFLQEYLKIGEQAKKLLFGAKVIYWILINRGRENAKTIQEQYLAGTIKLNIDGN
jgi:hypothetical protein